METIELLGRICRYSNQKGYGFISQDQVGDGLGDCWFHFRDVVTDESYIKTGSRVTFRMGERGGRRCAVLVEILEDSDYDDTNSAN